MSHLETDEPETRLPANEARAGVTGHNVRYVLALGLGGVIFCCPVFHLQLAMEQNGAMLVLY